MRLRIASYNIRKGRGLDGRKRPERILKVIEALGADVVVLQEADHRLGRRPAALPRHLIESETDYDIVPLGGSEVSLGWHGNAVLVRRGIVVSATEQYDLPGLEPRGAVSVTLGDAAPLRVVGVHLGLLRPSRRKQLQNLRDRLDDHHGSRTLILGDFNEWSDRQIHAPLAPDYALAHMRPSFPAALPLAQLDRIAHGRDLDILATGVAPGHGAKIASDHLPIWAEVAARPTIGHAKPD